MIVLMRIMIWWNSRLSKLHNGFFRRITVKGAIVFASIFIVGIMNLYIVEYKLG